MAASTALLDAFTAAGPAPELADRLHLFGQFVGSWDLTVTDLDGNGAPTVSEGEWHFGWALAGRAVADVWICPRRTPDGGSPGEHGVSLRFYDPSIDAWRSTWMGPGRGLVRTFVARPTAEGIVLDGRCDGVGTRWSFSDITDASFRWRNEQALGGAGGWRLVQTFDARRR